MTAEQVYSSCGERRHRRFQMRLGLSWVVVVATPLLFATAFASTSFSWLESLGIFPFFLPLSLPYLAFLWRTVRASAALNSDEHPIPRKRPRILLLRSFIQDTISADRNVFLEGVLTSFSYVFHSLLPTTNLQRLVGPEVERQLGEWIGLCGPKDWFPPLDVRFIPAEDAEWRNVVAALAEDAKAIFVGIGGTDNLQWELEHLRKTGAMGKVFALIGMEADLENHWGRVVERWAACGYSVSPEFPGTGSVLTFDPEGRSLVIVRNASTGGEMVGAIAKVLAGETSHLEVAATTGAPNLVREVGRPESKVDNSDQEVGGPYDDEEMKQWRKRLLRGVFSGGVAGFALVCSSVVVMMAGCYLTYQWMRSSRLEIPNPGRGTALILGLPSILCAVGSFYLFSPIFYRLHQTRTGGPVGQAPTGESSHSARKDP